MRDVGVTKKETSGGATLARIIEVKRIETVDSGRTNDKFVAKKAEQVDGVVSDAERLVWPKLLSAEECDPSIPK